MSTPRNEPAFPSHAHDMIVPDEGMSLRDYFAAKAMQGILASPKSIGSSAKLTQVDIAQQAYLIADAMLT